MRDPAVLDPPQPLEHAVDEQVEATPPLTPSSRLRLSGAVTRSRPAWESQTLS